MQNGKYCRKCKLVEILESARNVYNQDIFIRCEPESRPKVCFYVHSIDLDLLKNLLL